VLRERYPALYFRSSTSNLLAEDSQRLFATANVPVNGKSKIKTSDGDALGREAILEALQSVVSKLGKLELSITVVGMTNVSTHYHVAVQSLIFVMQVGKSALINSLLRRSAVAVYNSSTPRDRDGTAPSTTLYPQCVTLTHKKKTFKFIDTPGLSFIPPPQPDSIEDVETRIARDVLLRNRGNISKIKDPLPAALYLLSRAVMEDLLMLYNLPAVQAGDYDAFLSSLARKEGALQKRVGVDIYSYDTVT
jgi:nuclear GTP-binding protein